MQSTEVSTYLAKVAARLRSWRGDEGLTLQQVASRSGVAASTIQKVESQQMVPTIAVLFKIANGLGRGPAELIDDSSGAPEVAFRGGTAAQADPEPIEPLTGDLLDAQLSSWRLEHRPGRTVEVVELGPNGEALIYCERGQLEVKLAEQAYLLSAGDSLHFKTRAPLSWTAVGSEPAILLLSCTDAVGVARLMARLDERG